MIRCTITNKGRAWLMEPEDALLYHVLAALAEPQLEAETNDEMFVAFRRRMRGQVDPGLDDATLYALWHRADSSTPDQGRSAGRAGRRTGFRVGRSPG